MREKVLSGAWRPGTMLPGRRDLAAQYKVSSVTVGRAVDVLSAEGIVRTDNRRGTFICLNAIDLAGGSQRLAAGSSRGNARSIQNHKTQVVGIVATTHNDWLSQDGLILHTIEQVLADAGIVTRLCNRAGSNSKQLVPLGEAIASVRAEGVSAVALICLDLDRTQIVQQLQDIDAEQLPLVCILAGELDLPVPHVFYDNRIAGQQAAMHLLDKGHHDITVFAPITATWVEERIEGICQLIARRDGNTIQVCRGSSLAWTYTMDPVTPAYHAAKELIASGWSPAGGVVCISDQVAYGFMRAASEAGYGPGADYAIIGFDDHPEARYAALTTMRPPLESMGREACKLLLDQSAGNRGAIQLRLKAQLIPRLSTHGSEQRTTETREEAKT